MICTAQFYDKIYFFRLHIPNTKNDAAAINYALVMNLQQPSSFL